MRLILIVKTPKVTLTAKLFMRFYVIFGNLRSVCCSFLIKVHLCEASNMGEFLGDDFLVNRTNSMSMLVAVKVMRPDADPKSRYMWILLLTIA